MSSLQNIKQIQKTSRNYFLDFFSSGMVVKSAGLGAISLVTFPQEANKSILT